MAGPFTHGSSFLNHPSGPLPPSPEPAWLDEPRQPVPLTLPRFDPVAAPAPRRGRPWVNLALFLATIATTTYWGALHHQRFVTDYEATSPAPFVLLHGLWYSVTILAILGTHELGHYYACRYYRVDASLPYFLPAPFMTGTLGAVISIPATDSHQADALRHRRGRTDRRLRCGGAGVVSGTQPVARRAVARELRRAHAR